MGNLDSVHDEHEFWLAPKSGQRVDRGMPSGYLTSPTVYPSLRRANNPGLLMSPQSFHQGKQSTTGESLARSTGLTTPVAETSENGWSGHCWCRSKKEVAPTYSGELSWAPPTLQPTPHQGSVE